MRPMRPNLFDDLPAPHPFLTLRGPANTPVSEVCPHCKRETSVYAFRSPDGCRIESHHCEEHGDVPPMRSAIINPALPLSVWDGEGP